MSTNVTIAEIARNAGVGTATVDRVLNGRTGVNSETERKVLQAIDSLGAPAVMRGRPRTKGNWKFAYVLPAGQSHFLDQVERQIAQAAGDFRHQHITGITYRFDAQDPAQFALDLSRIAACDAIVLLAPDAPAVKLAINDHVRAGVHVLSLLSDVAGSMRQAYVGADSRAAGRTAGLLLGRMARDPRRNVLLLLSQATRMSNEIERRIGFVQVIEERFPELEVLRIMDLPGDDAQALEFFNHYLCHEMDHTRLGGVYTVGGASAGIAAALRDLGLTDDAPLLAHDLTSEHQAMLVNGSLTYVLHQDVHYCVLAAARTLRGLCESIRGAPNVVQPRVEILTAENLH